LIAVLSSTTREDGREPRRHPGARFIEISKNGMVRPLKAVKSRFQKPLSPVFSGLFRQPGENGDQPVAAEDEPPPRPGLRRRPEPGETRASCVGLFDEMKIGGIKIPGSLQAFPIDDLKIT